MFIVMRRFTLFLLAFVLGVTLIASPEVLAAPQADQDAATYDTVYYDENVYENPACASTTGSPASASTPGATSKVPTTFSLGIGPAQRQVNLIKTLMADYGLTAAQAAGIVGNFIIESAHTSEAGASLPPDVNEDDTTGAPPKFSGGYGWAQWTGTRQHTFINYAIKNGYMSSASVHATDAANYAYLKSELNSGYKSTIPDLKKQTTPENASLSWERTFEIAGAPALGERSKAAREAFDYYSATNGGAGSNPEGGTTPDVPCGAPATGGTGIGIVGNIAFPLAGGKHVVKNPGMFHNNTADRGGHPYIAFDILADPGTEIVAFMDGVVTHIGRDRCPGQLISVYNAKADLVISYLHMDFANHVAEGDTLQVGQRIGIVGPAANGCGIAHLHIDAAAGKVRPGCSRLNCPITNASKFRDIGPQLYQTFQKLPN